MTISDDSYLKFVDDDLLKWQFLMMKWKAGKTGDRATGWGAAEQMIEINSLWKRKHQIVSIAGNEFSLKM